MPELPEVETIVRMLAPHAEGKRIAAAELRLARMLPGMSAKDFRAALEGRRIRRILRRGKYIVIELDGPALIIHLGMTGQLTWSPARYRETQGFTRTLTGLERPKGVHPVDRHTHLVLHLAGGARILFRDPRTFGKLFVTAAASWPEHPRLRILGTEPFDPEAARLLAERYPGRSIRAIKAVLLDQSFVAGVGNIYADEALFRCGIHPRTRACDLGAAQRKALVEAVKAVLRKGIRNQGTSFSDYRKPDGTAGSNYERLQVYGRGGMPCRRCGSLLVKSVLAQRGTVHCPSCQPARRPAR